MASSAARSGIAHEAIAVAWSAAVSAATLALALCAGILMRDVQRGLTPDPWAPLRIAALPPLPVIDADAFVHGRALFTATCATCHGPKGTGVAGLGKDLTHSRFVCDLDDPGLVAFLKQGRDVTDPLNTTRVPMPPRGGNPNFTDADLDRIVAFVRGLQDPRRAPNVPAAELAPPIAAVPPTEAEKAKALAAAGGDPELAACIAHGMSLFMASCASCHGRDAHGMPGLGKNLATSEFAGKLDDDGLLAFLKRGRDPSDPANTTKVAMPPKGGNPALSEDDLLDIIDFVRSLQKAAQAGAPPSSAPAAGAASAAITTERKPQ